jgi:CRP/FNR family transcriptional regulator, anaerobic regulatory protein
MSGSCFAERIGDHLDLTEVEQKALHSLEERERNVKRGGVLVRENDPATEIFILRKGLMMSYVLLDDGSRQILRFLFPGDMVGAGGLVYHEGPETIVALADSVVCPFDKTSLAALMETHPRLAAMILVYAQIERVALTDRLAALGRTSAKARVAALLLEMRNRYRVMDKAIGGEFVLGLTQEEIGDATGLTAVHVNRMLRQLEDDRLISREGGRVKFTDEKALMRAANYVDRYENLDLSWLPKAK